MLDKTNTSLNKLSVHHVGNKTNGENIQLSSSELDIRDDRLREILLKYFLHSFNKPEYYSFTFEDDDFSQNPVFNFASAVFENPNSLHENSIEIAKLLYEISEHPNIKAGDLFVAFIRDIIVDDEMVDAVGIFKSENKHPFLKVLNEQQDINLAYEDGINIEKLDKGCLILNTEKNIGYRVCIVDNTSKSIEAQFWKDIFLKLKPFNDDYYYTKQYMNAAKKFVMDELPEENEVTRLEQIELLNRSSDYFKTHGNFNQKEFEDEILQDEGRIQSFRNFNNKYSAENNVDFSEPFEISPEAVKNQSRIFKSVLKLDRNFHIYIHGDYELIERGTERDGRKFYKIYYENEG